MIASVKNKTKIMIQNKNFDINKKATTYVKFIKKQ
mgnify:CR=1 FL=1